jgi:DNA-binding transcriptional LysR family regulator
MLLTEYGRALLVRARRVHAEMQRARTELAAIVEKGSPQQGQGDSADHARTHFFDGYPSSIGF